MPVRTTTTTQSIRCAPSSGGRRRPAAIALDGACRIIPKPNSISQAAQVQLWIDLWCIEDRPDRVPTPRRPLGTSVRARKVR